MWLITRFLATQGTGIILKLFGPESPCLTHMIELATGVTELAPNKMIELAQPPSGGCMASKILFVFCPGKDISAKRNTVRNHYSAVNFLLNFHNIRHIASIELSKFHLICCVYEGLLIEKHSLGKCEWVWKQELVCVCVFNLFTHEAKLTYNQHHECTDVALTIAFTE